MGKRSRYLGKGPFFNYIDKTGLVGFTRNVNGMQIFPYISRTNPMMSTGGVMWSIMGKICSTNGPLNVTQTIV